MSKYYDKCDSCKEYHAKTHIANEQNPRVCFCLECWENITNAYHEF